MILARASVCLARLRDVQLIETLSTVIEHLVKGDLADGWTERSSSDQQVRFIQCFEDYEKKYYKPDR